MWHQVPMPTLSASLISSFYCLQSLCCDVDSFTDCLTHALWIEIGYQSVHKQAVCLHTLWSNTMSQQMILWLGLCQTLHRFHFKVWYFFVVFFSFCFGFMCYSCCEFILCVDFVLFWQWEKTQASLCLCAMKQMDALSPMKSTSECVPSPLNKHRMHLPPFSLR
jgi:hypothetical protein